MDVHYVKAKILYVHMKRMLGKPTKVDENCVL